MPDLFEELTEEQTTAGLLDDNRVVNFAYTQGAFDRNEVTWQGTYNYNAPNNIPDSPELAPDTQENGFGAESGVQPRAFANHYFGRLSYNLNKMVQTVKQLLDSMCGDYAANISEYSEDIKYKQGDVCFRVTSSGSDSYIDFYRCTADYTGQPPWSWNSMKSYWVRPEEYNTHYRPVVGLPIMWYAQIPDWAIRCDDGKSYLWSDYPALNFDEFRAFLTDNEDFGASVSGTGFTVPNYTGRTCMFAGGDNEVLSGYSGASTDACVDQTHIHTASISQSSSSTSISHSHDSHASSSNGAHTHTIATPVQKYSAVWDDDHRMPADDIGKDDFSLNTKMTTYNHTHKVTSGSSGVGAHTHTLSVSGGSTGAASPAGGTMGNPDGYTGSWIVRFR